MVSTFSPSLGYELPATGDQAGVWGDTTNTNIGSLGEQAVAGVQEVPHDDSASITLLKSDGALDQARNAVVIITGAITADRAVVVPDFQKVYAIVNATTGGFALNINAGGVPSISIAFGGAEFLYATGVSNNIALVTDTATIFADINKLQPTLGLKNFIVNPFYQISQENGDTLGTVDQYYAADTWLITFGFSGTASFQRVGTPFTSLPEIRRALEVVVTSGAALGANDLMSITTKIEGERLRGMLNWGGASAEPARIGFLSRSNITHTFCLCLRNSASDRSYVTELTNVANTDTWHSVDIPADFTGGWDQSAGVGVDIFITLGTGTTFQTSTTDAWQAGNFIGTPTQTNFAATTNNTFDMGPMLMWNTDFDMPTTADDLQAFQNMFAHELIQCQRYYEEGDSRVIGGGNNLDFIGAWVNFHVKKRAAPGMDPGTPVLLNCTGPSIDAPVVDGFRQFAQMTSTNSNGQYEAQGWRATSRL